MVSAFFTSDNNKSGIFDDVIITSTLYCNKLIMEAHFTCFSKTYHRNNVCQNSKNTFKLVKVIYGRLLVFFRDTVYNKAVN